MRLLLQKCKKVQSAKIIYRWNVDWLKLWKGMFIKSSKRAGNMEQENILMVTIKTLGEKQGDCFFIEIQNDVCKNIIMVDGQQGDLDSFQEIKKLILDYGQIDYLVITHIDNDHINGILKIFELPETDDVRRAFQHTIIFYNHVIRPIISYSQAQELEKLIGNNVVVPTIRRNYNEFSSPCLKILSAEQRKYFDPQQQENSNNYVVMTFLYPHKQGVEKVHQDYLKNKKKASSNLINKNSIAFLLEHGQWAALFTGDGYMRDIMDELSQLKNMREGDSFRQISLVKIPHHGAEENNKDLAVFCERHAVCKFILTGQKKWDAYHPSKKVFVEVDQIHKNENPIYLFTNISVPFINDLKHIKLIDSDTIR